MEAVLALYPAVGLQAACDHLAVARASFYRQRPAFGPLVEPPGLAAIPAIRAKPARALSTDERTCILDVLHAERFQDRAPAAVQATLLDEGQYLCSTRTMYRILEQEGELQERRQQRVHPPYQKPELLATTRTFLDYFGLKRLDELPPLSELKDIGELEPQLPFEPAIPAAASMDTVEMGSGNISAESSETNETNGEEMFSDPISEDTTGDDASEASSEHTNEQ